MIAYFKEVIGTDDICLRVITAADNPGSWGDLPANKLFSYSISGGDE